MMKSRLIFRTFAIVALLYSGILNSAVPGQVNFQGVLLDNSNQLINGTTDFDFAMFDAASGGTLLWSENQTGVPVNNGAYSVALGSVSPISASVLSSGTVYLEVTVDGDTLSPRQRLLAVPYALEAASVSGVSGTFVQQIFQHIDYDGEPQANDHPDQGFDDIDNDGIANFIDPDNDGDGISDGQELSNGTAVNVYTPVITSVLNAVTAQPTAQTGINQTITISGTGFQPGMTIQIGAETPAPQNVTFTSFDISVGATQTSGPTTITLTIPNAEIATSSITFYDNTVFVTDGALVGALNKTTAEADAYCNSSASGAGLLGTYVAWFSDVDTGIGPLNRLTGSNSWARPDGVIVATSLSDLTDGSIAAPIQINEHGNSLGGGVLTPATNTLSNGLPDPLSCSAANPTTGLTGSIQSTSSGWTAVSSTFFCTTQHRYYCFGQ